MSGGLGLHCPDGWGVVPSLGRLGSVLFFFPREQVTAAAGSPAPPCTRARAASSLLPGFPMPAWLRAIRLLVPGAGATSQRPGIREEEGKAIWLPPGSAVWARLTPVPSSFSPAPLPGDTPPFPPPQPASQPALAPGQMHRLRTDLICDLGSYAQSRVDRDGALRDPYPTWASVSGRSAVAKARAHTEWVGLG